MLSVSLCCSFLIAPSIYSSVYFFLCLVYPMLSVSLCCSFFIVPSVYSSVYFVLCFLYPMLTVSLCCSFLIALLFTVVFILSCFLCIRCCQCLFVVPFVYSSDYFVLCLVYPMLLVYLCCSFCLL